MVRAPSSTSSMPDSVVVGCPPWRTPRRARTRAGRLTSVSPSLMVAPNRRAPGAARWSHRARMSACRRTSRSCGPSTWAPSASSPRTTSGRVSPPAAPMSRPTSTPATCGSRTTCAHGRGRARSRRPSWPTVASRCRRSSSPWPSCGARRRRRGARGGAGAGGRHYVSVLKEAPTGGAGDRGRRLDAERSSSAAGRPPAARRAQATKGHAVQRPGREALGVATKRNVTVIRALIANGASPRPVRTTPAARISASEDSVCRHPRRRTSRKAAGSGSRPTESRAVARTQ